ncbi:unnamed protein product [Pleuronectes platessa]|uniref:Uncharacterized protein n=1 Tax=Pleuronectes platessa TaxID=8262 RepID=A0A9N7U3V0_PLEPL|nr:unnamed protein product [Pleuronectes platessa]
MGTTIDILVSLLGSIRETQRLCVMKCRPVIVGGGAEAPPLGQHIMGVVRKMSHHLAAAGQEHAVRALQEYGAGPELQETGCEADSETHGACSSPLLLYWSPALSVVLEPAPTQTCL